VSKCAMTTLVRTITVAAGVYAPGHLGSLTPIVSFELVDALLEECGRVEQRLRDLPSRVGVYLVLAMGLFEQVGLALVYSKLVAGLSGLQVPAPSEAALRGLRRRVGPEPVKALFEVLAGPLAQPGTPGACYRRYRTVAFDGCSSIKAPDHPRIVAYLGKVLHRQGLAGHPMLRLIALVETGTRGMLGAAFGGWETGEIDYARRLLHLLGPGMLLLDDRGFDSNAFLAEVLATKAQFLVRAMNTRKPPVLAILPDGSYLTRIGQMRLRVIEASVTAVSADGSSLTGTYRLLTTLLDHRIDPAAQLIALYHERWEIESAYFALRHTMLRGRVLRSKDRAGIEQELWGILALYQILRTAMVEACEQVSGTDPDRAGFTIALETARDHVVNATGIHDETGDPRGGIAPSILADLLPPRRPRVYARVVKSPLSRYHRRPSQEQYPLTSTVITELHVLIHMPEQVTPPPQKTTRKTTPKPAKSRPTPTPKRPNPARPRPPSREAAFVFLRQRPNHSAHAADLARDLGITGTRELNNFRTRMSQWSTAGLLTKTGRATYTLTTTHQRDPHHTTKTQPNTPDP
jgi:hypothetical protein